MPKKFFKKGVTENELSFETDLDESVFDCSPSWITSKLSIFLFFIL